MKRLFLCLFVLLAGVWAASAQLNYGAPQIVVSNLLSPTVINGTNNGAKAILPQ